MIGLSPLSAGHRRRFQPTCVRPSTGSYPRFSLPTDSSPGFASAARDSSRPVKARFRSGSLSVNLAPRQRLAGSFYKRNSFRASVARSPPEVEHRMDEGASPPTESNRTPNAGGPERGSQSMWAKLCAREGNSPDRPLRSPSSSGRISLAQETSGSRRTSYSLVSRYSCQHSHSHALHRRSPSGFSAHGKLPYRF